MGQFSWLTKQGEQIRNEYHNGQKVWMVFKKDNEVKVVKEEEYEGYGVFGGLDYFEVLAQMNGNTTRDEGLEDYYTAGEFNHVQFPQLFTHEPTDHEIDSINWVEPNPDDPNQGWVVEEEEDDDWYND